MLIELKADAFDPYAVLAEYQSGFGIGGDFGATAVFVGTMRGFNDGETIRAMTLEHYPGMTEKHLRQICAEAAERWAVLDYLVLHRVGDVSVGDAIVLVAVWSAHRGDAMDACRFIIEDLKHKAPFWKKERLADGERWVKSNTVGYVETAVEREPWK